MEVKKNPNADLKRFSGLFLNVGLVLSLLFTIVAFEWKTYDDVIMDLGNVTADFEEVIEIPPTELPPPPPPVIQQPEIIEVEDEEEIEEIEVELDVEVTEETVVEQVVIEDEVEEEVVEEIFTIVEESTEPLGGMQAFYTYVANYLSKNYPERAKKAQIQGKVFLTFVVEKDGSITDMKVLRGIGGGCDEAAMDAVMKFGKWKPGKQRGRAVRQRMNLPISFKIG